jgi:Uma2 family endonuclease
MVAAPTIPQVEIIRRRFTVAEYYRLLEADILHEDERVELIEGEIVAMSPMKPRHANTIIKSTNRLVPLVLPDAVVSVQCPIQVGTRSLPEPDLAIVRAERPTDAHPTPADIFVAIEVADSSLDYDRTVKFPLYANAGIPEAWLVNLSNDTIERHSAPRDGRYTQIAIFGRADTISSLILPHLSLPIAHLLA